uniref:Uncharacterized protein n=1 Tax=Rhizophora mucronata TaxID=61149 RepID=A0A2P2QHM9_RHIMU
MAASIILFNLMMHFVLRVQQVTTNSSPCMVTNDNPINTTAKVSASTKGGNKR